MIKTLEIVRRQCSRPADAVRWACLLEATAPKPGNVFPGHDFDDLVYADFVRAAEIAADAFEQTSNPFSIAVLEATTQIAQQLGTNVNLGILLLIGPLIQADCHHADCHGTSTRLRRAEFRELAKQALAGMTADDSRRLYQAINAANPGGMGKSDTMDLAGPAPEDFVAAMASAASRDRIAGNYADGLADLFQNIIPVLETCISQQQDLLAGIVAAHLQLLAAEPDSLIKRKFGPEVANQVQQQADFDHHDPERRDALARFLDAGSMDLQGNPARLNPGTTADLIAAALFVLLRESQAS